MSARVVIFFSRRYVSTASQRERPRSVELSVRRWIFRWYVLRPSPNMSALTLRLTPWASSSDTKSRNTWLATWARGAREPHEVASWAMSTVVWRTMAWIRTSMVIAASGEQRRRSYHVALPQLGATNWSPAVGASPRERCVSAL